MTLLRLAAVGRHHRAGEGFARGREFPDGLVQQSLAGLHGMFVDEPAFFCAWTIAASAVSMRGSCFRQALADALAARETTTATEMSTRSVMGGLLRVVA
jgi:hypothetical protein